MAKHKDLSRVSALLDGTQGWFIEKLGESGIEKRTKTKCKHYVTGKKYCRYANTLCCGVDCGSWERKEENNTISKNERRSKNKCWNYQKPTNYCYKLKDTCKGVSMCKYYLNGTEQRYKE